MKLTYKAIAILCGYTMYSSYTEFPNIHLKYAEWWQWEDKEGRRGYPQIDEASAWKHCCTSQGLAEE